MQSQLERPNQGLLFGGEKRARPSAKSDAIFRVSRRTDLEQDRGTGDRPPLDTTGCHVARPVFLILERYRHEADPQRLGSLVHELVSETGFSDLEPWISTYASSWLLEKRPALAAVVEAAVHKSLPGVAELIREILSVPSAHPLVVSVAAQRIRLLPPLSTATKRDIWIQFRALLKRWENAGLGQELAFAVRSVPYVAGEDAISVLAGFIESADDLVANSAALGLLDWASGSIPNGEVLKDDEARSLYETTFARMEKTERGRAGVPFDLYATFLWLLGALTQRQEISRTSSLIADAFTKPRGLEAGAAIRAGKQILKRFPEHALPALIAALGGMNASDFTSFVTAVFEPSR
jgi:hypothetical protein